jgi:type II secretory pathway pseudopilin PulG
MIVVIFVIALLISILLPSLKRSMDMAKATACKSNLREIGRALFIYQTESNGWLPVPAAALRSNGSNTNSPTASAGSDSDPWFARLFPTYLPDFSVLQCPKDPYAYRINGTVPGASASDFADQASYGINDFMLTAAGGYLANIERHAPKRAIDTILVGDLGPDVNNNSGRRSAINGPSRSGGLMNWADGYDPFNDTYAPSWLTVRHGTGIHMVTLNGTVREARTQELMRTPIKPFYPACAAGGCTFCTELKIPHYSFAKEHLYWWTGLIPTD